MIDSRWEVGIVEGTFRDFLKFALNKLDKDARTGWPSIPTASASRTTSYRWCAMPSRRANRTPS